MYRYIVVVFLSLQILIPLLLAESTDSSTRLEYKLLDNVPMELQSEMKPFKKINQTYYLIENDEVNWFQAAQRCRANASNLISLTTENERKLIGIELNKTKNYWVDISNLGQDEYVSISTGLQFKQKLAWFKDDVEDMNNEHKVNEKLNCVLLVNDYQDGFVMKKTQCLNNASYICQLALARTISLVVW